MVLAELGVLILAVIVLSRSSGWVVDSSVKLSSFFGMSQIAMGFIFMAVATSLPELSVSVMSAAVGEGALAAGNVFGSNIANILLILGIGAFLYGVKISPSNLKDIGLVLLLTTVISVWIVFNSLFQQTALGLAEGVLLLAGFGIYAWYRLQGKPLISMRMNGKVSRPEALKQFLLFFGGILVVIVSSGFVVDSAVQLARGLGIAESFIGATIIAVGTSLPELSTALEALRKKHYGLALGDAVGSNLVNLTLVLGVAAVINPITVQIPIFIAALLFAVITNTILFYTAVLNKGVGRKGGVLFLATYAVYLIVIFVLQTMRVMAGP